jgi:hypothetical protein
MGPYRSPEDVHRIVSGRPGHAFGFCRQLWSWGRRRCPDELPVRIGCEMNNFALAAILRIKTARRIDLTSQLAPIADAGLGEADAARAVTVVGTRRRTKMRLSAW